MKAFIALDNPFKAQTGLTMSLEKAL